MADGNKKPQIPISAITQMPVRETPLKPQNSATTNNGLLSVITNINGIIKLNPILSSIILRPPLTEVQTRLHRHKGFLNAMGISDLNALGKMTLIGMVMPQHGLSIPQSDLLGPEQIFQSAYRYSRSGAIANLLPLAGKARLLKAFTAPISQPTPNTPPSMRPKMFVPQSSAAPQTPFLLPDHAYWAAEWIDIQANTVVVIPSTLKYLTIITNKLTVGDNVTITWDRPAKQALAIPSKPAKPARPAVSCTIDAPPPAPNGINGTNGNQASAGDPGPELEIWTLNLTGNPGFDVRGQDGLQGGTGGDGGDGADGAPGKPSEDQLLWCKSGQGYGGNGGNGGKAGNGGAGGSGGHGGSLSLFIPEQSIAAYTQNCYVTVDGGSGGAGGMPGTPGVGGIPGPVGVLSSHCDRNPSRTDGHAGAQGAKGDQGSAGNPGDHGAISMQAITADDFNLELEKPAILELSPSKAHVGETVAVSGARFTHTDVVLIDGAAVDATIISDTLLNFKVPAAQGEWRKVEIRQSDGTLSNAASLFILPSLTGVSPAGALRPGTTATLTGSGFAPGLRVQLNSMDMPNVQFVNQSTVTFTVARPAGVTPNADGEQVKAQVVLSGGSTTNQLDLVLDTYRIVVFGDSVAWGQGLQEASKFHALVGATVSATHADIGVYKDVFAHSGAIIGVGDSHMEAAMHGEVPSSYPTILQQVDSFTGQADNVDLILMDGGANDYHVSSVCFDPTITADEHAARIKGACYDSMKSLISKVSSRFTQARIIVTGYYQILSSQSDLTLFDAFAVALGAATGFTTTALTEAEKQIVLANFQRFATDSNKWLKQAVDEANATAGGTPRIFFADPGFGPENATFAPHAYTFDVQLPDSSHPAITAAGIPMPIAAEDSIAVDRAAICVVAASHNSSVDETTCMLASAGHPNEHGALAYAHAITPLL